MINGVKQRKIKKLIDARGFFMKPVENTFIGNSVFGEIYISAAMPGQIKGNHFHIEAKEWFLIIRGEGILVLEKDDNRIEFNLNANDPTSIEVPPRVHHAFKNTGKEELWVLAYTDKPYVPEDTLSSNILF